MNRFSTLVLLGGLMAIAPTAMAENQLAFPGAEGFGKYAVGGRYGSVYHVTNLNDSGTGSLRDAVSSSNRIIVFDVAGVIHLESRLVFKNNLYVAGQTAPGEGITVYGNGVSFSGASNTIVRHMRFRMGVNGDSGKDAVGIANGTNMIFDHVSASWGRDETFSISPDGKGDLNNITVQNSVISQGLLTHSAGGLVQAENITLYRNLYVDNSTRNAKVKGRNQYVNNIVYNWANGCFIMGGDSEGVHYTNAQGNLFINGPSGGGNAFTGANSDFHMYATDNWQDRDKDGVLDPYEIPNSEFSGGPTFMTSPMEAYDLPIVSAVTLLDESLPTVGASLPYRDYADWYVVNQVKSLGKSGGFISRETSLPFGAPTSWSLWAGNEKVDTDGDGMPDAWEDANGTDKTVDDAMKIAANGYANIENYINSITVADRDVYLRAPLCPSLKTSTQESLSIEWLNYTEGEDGVVVELKVDGTFIEVARLAADAENYTITGLTPETSYTIRLKAFNNAGLESPYSVELTVKTKPVPIDMVDVENYISDYIWSGADGAWNLSAANWLNADGTAATFVDESNVLINPSEDITITLEENVSPSAILVKGDAVTTITGSGAIAGSASVNKTGEGTLVLNTTNSYKGQTVLHEGTIEFNSLANGDVNSAIGASSEFAQNWVWNGGTWKYTGGSVATNRQALTYAQTEFNIANGATVTANGHIEGVGGITLGGNGQLTVNTTSFFQYEGPTILKGSTMYWNSTDVSKAGIGKSSKLVFAGGTLKTKGDSKNYETYSFPIEVQENTYSVLNIGKLAYLKSAVSGEGTLEMQVNYVREYIQGSWNNFTGRLIANGVGSESDGSQFMFEKSHKGLPNAVVEAKGNIRILGWSTGATSISLGGLSGDQGTYLSCGSKNTTGASMTWKVGASGTNETFHGVIDNRCSSTNYNASTSIVKEGIGDWRLTGNNVYKGTTVVNDGRLIVNGKHTGTGQVTVQADATLAGIGTIAAPVRVNDGAILYAGDTAVVNTNCLKFTGAVTCSTGAIVEIPLLRTGVLNKSNRLSFQNKVTFTGAVLALNLDEVTVDFKSDSYFVLFDLSKATVTGEFASIVPAAPSATQVWDTSELYTSGRLYIRDAATGIDGIETEASAVVRTELYDLCGSIVSRDNAKGIFIEKTWTQDGKVSVKRVLLK